MKLNHAIKLMFIAICLLGVTASNAHAQKKVKKIAQTITNSVMPPHISLETRLEKIYVKIEPLILRMQIQGFVSQHGHWPRADRASKEEMLLAKRVNRFIWEHENTNEPFILALKQLRQAVQQAEREDEIFLQLSTFINKHKSWPRTEIRSITGTLNKVEDMSAEQIAEFKLAHQIEYILEKDPSSAVAQQIQALKENWNK